MVKAIDCKSIGKPPLVRIQSTSNILKLLYFHLFKKIKVKRRYFIAAQLPVHFNFLKRPRAIKFSFLFFYLIKKKNIFLQSGVDIFFFNSFYLLFFKKAYEILLVFQKNLFFIADASCNFYSRISDLNFFCNKNSYIYFTLKKYDLNAARILLNDQTYFVFLFVSSSNSRFLYLNNSSNICPLLGISATPSFFNFFLPILVNLPFSIYFYKYFFYNLLKQKVF